MIYSMTGFANAALELDTATISLELRSVNNRYLDIQLRLPDELRLLEPALREAISAQVTRGKIECRVNYQPLADPHTPAGLNPRVLAQLALWSDEIRAALPAARELGVAEILRWPGIFSGAAEDVAALQDKMGALLQQCLHEFNAARAREGGKLQQFLLQRAGQIEALRQQVAPRIPAALQAYEAKLLARLQEALHAQDDERIQQEISLFAHRIDVDEELSRLRVHLQEVERVLEQGGNVGKRLDFLMQELHREANTLGAKSADSEVARAAIDIKLLIEQMREQVQNLA